MGLFVAHGAYVQCLYVIFWVKDRRGYIYIYILLIFALRKFGVLSKIHRLQVCMR